MSQPDYFKLACDITRSYTEALTMSQPTPGPWVIDEYYAKGGFYKIRAKDDSICHVHSFADSEEPESEATANARLIAQAPALRAALRKEHDNTMGTSISGHSAFNPLCDVCAVLAACEP